MLAEFFIAEGKGLFPRGWGDAGSILQHGMTSHTGRNDGKLSLERTGPYIPPITFPGIGDVVLTSEAKSLVESSGLTGFGFLPITKLHISNIDWRSWDLSEEWLPESPYAEEPEDYVLKYPHSEEAALALGDLWELVVPETARINNPPDARSHAEIGFDLNSWNGADLVRPTNYKHIVFSRKARDFFVGAWSDFVEFDLLPVVRP